MTDCNFYNVIKDIDEDLKKIIYLEKGTNSLIIHSMNSINKKLTIIYSDKIKSYIFNTSKATMTLKKIDFQVVFEDEYVSDCWESDYRIDAVKCGFLFSKKEEFEFLLCDIRKDISNQAEYNDFISSMFLDYNDIKFDTYELWYKKVFSSFHLRKIKQIKRVLDAYIAWSPCLKNKKKINFIKL